MCVIGCVCLCVCIRLQEDVRDFVSFYKCMCVCVQSVHIWACVCAFVRVCAFVSVSLRERQREAVCLRVFCRSACKSTPKLSRAQHFSHTHFCYTHTYMEAMHTLYPFQHEHTGILSLRFSLHLSFFLLLSRVQEGEKRDREREKEWWCVLSLSLHIHSNAFTRTTPLSHSSLLLTNICMHAIHTWLHECLFICACLSVCYLLMPSLHIMFSPRFDFAFVHKQFTVACGSDCMVVIPSVGNVWILKDTQEPEFETNAKLDRWNVLYFHTPNLVG